MKLYVLKITWLNGDTEYCSVPEEMLFLKDIRASLIANEIITIGDSTYRTSVIRKLTIEVYDEEVKDDNV